MLKQVNLQTKQVLKNGALELTYKIASIYACFLVDTCIVFAKNKFFSTGN